MTIEQQLQAIGAADTQTQEAIKQMCLELARKKLSNESLSQDETRDYYAYQYVTDAYIAQVN